MFLPGKLLAPFVALVLSLSAAPAALGDDPVTSKPDESWITVSGTAVSTDAHGFKLDYGNGLISVEMDDWDWFPEGREIMPGNYVTVHGRIDDDMYEARSIEAGKVFVKQFNSVFTSPNYAGSYLKVISANPSDEELGAEVYAKYTFTPLTEGADVSITGKIASIKDKAFIIKTGANQLTVDTSKLGYNPLDDKGYQKIDEGDVVTVSGKLNLGFFAKREIEAKDITKLVQSSK
ncbi:MAG: OB-fold nucleic acid binding domain-containing protein [Ketobacteraceae bacterium]|nr:OB-fold nucleic acid binding domain-containing protein [Ketobacteraceae bacterium]